MEGKLRYDIFTGPLDEDWLVAEIYCHEQHFATLTHWGTRLVVFTNYKTHLEFDTDEFINLLKVAKNRLRQESSEDE